MKKFSRLSFLSTIILLIYSLSYLVYYIITLLNPSISNNSENSTTYFYLTLILLLLTTFVILVKLDILPIDKGINETKNSNSEESNIASMERSLSSEIQTLREEMNSRLEKASAASQKIDANLVQEIAESAVQERLDEELGENIVEAIGKKVASQTHDFAKKSSTIDTINRLFDVSQTRVNEHAHLAKTSSTTFRRVGFLLAWVGVLIAIGNAALFYYELYSGSTDSTIDKQDFVSLLRHLPFTLPLILLSEALALIMFRYSSKSLEMMRYFSNEVTTLNLRRAGALTIVEHGSQKAITETAQELLTSERNIIMRKDEKTIETIQNRDESALVDSLTSKIEAVWGKKNSEKEN
jgi:vacuolar-type H+-ATPase subunit H